MGPEEKNRIKYIMTDGHLFEYDELSNHPLDLAIAFYDDWLYPLSKIFRCHSRKRFVKLVMSHGYSKRIANFLADILVVLCGSYQIAYMRFAMHNLICCQE